MQCVQPKKTQSKYKLIEKELKPDWPPVGEETTNDRGPEDGLTLNDGNYQMSINR